MVDSIIRLFDSSSTEFSTNGIGSLIDAYSCIVTEKRNGEFELTMDYPITGRYAKDICLRSILVAKSNPYSDPQAFRVYSISKPINGRLTINAQHISYDLSGYPVSPFVAHGINDAFVQMQNSSIVKNQPFIFWTDKNPKTNGATVSITTPTSMRSILGGVDGSILDIYGGEYEFNNFTVKLHTNRGANRGVSIRYGKNLTDLDQEENCNSIYTGVYPYWKDTDDNVVELPEKIINAGGTYNFTRIYILDTSDSFQEKPTEEQLRRKAKSFISNNNVGIPKVSLTVSFAQLAQSEEYKKYALLEEVHLCDTVNVEFPEMNVSATSKCIETKYNVITNKYTSISLGEARSKISDTISVQAKSIEEIPQKSEIEQTIDKATKLITGGLGGYVILRSSSGEKSPDEILIMDTNDVETATRVWRWNKNGLGYSSKGYNGPYATAITRDGQIVADFVTAGNINGGIITAGSIKMESMSSDFKDTLDDDYASKEITERDIASLQATVAGINASFANQTIGGINKIFNSSGLNGMSDDWTYTGSVTTLQNDIAVNNTVSGSIFSINNGKISQTINVIRNKTYTLSFKAKSNTSGHCYVSIRNGENDIYILNTQGASDYWSEYEHTFVASGNLITLNGETDGNNLYLADFMLVEGSTKSNWTPAPNEIYTTNVKIDRRGINIINTNSSTETIIDNTQFAVKSAGDTVLSVNKDLTTLRKTEVLDEFTIAKGRFIPVEGGLNFILLD